MLCALTLVWMLTLFHLLFVGVRGCPAGSVNDVASERIKASCIGSTTAAAVCCCCYQYAGNLLIALLCVSMLVIMIPIHAIATTASAPRPTWSRSVHRSRRCAQEQEEEGAQLHIPFIKHAVVQLERRGSCGALHTADYLHYSQQMASSFGPSD